jgi:CubicO group peptidase (beta-lactamase class C family)
MFRILTAMLILISAHAGAQPWPKDEWPRKSPAQAGIDQKKLQSLLSAAFAKHLTFETDGVVLIKDGHLVHEQYANGFTRDQKHALFSLGKTMINALIGVMEHQGLMNRNDELSRFYPAAGKRMTIQQLLHMSSGLEWIEEDRENLLQSDPWFAFYSRASYKDMPAWIAARSSLFQPDVKFNYSSGDSALLVAAMRGAAGESRHSSYAWDNLFTPLGMKSVSIERDGAGNLGLHGVGYASPLDVARLGLLYLRDGEVDGRKLWPADWLQFTRQMAPAQRNPFDPNDRNLQNNQAYGAHIWLNVKRPGDATKPYPELPSNALLGLGTRGQILLILPDQDLIFVRTGTDSLLMASLKGGHP